MQTFPKIIHQIWLQGYNNIPKKYHKNMESIKKLNSDYEYIFWDEVEILKLIMTNKMWITVYYAFIYMHQKIDYARYIILLIYGGIYVDMDASALKSFDDLLDVNKKYDMIVSKLGITKNIALLSCQYERCLNNGIIISKPNVPILKILINYINKHYECTTAVPKTLCINGTTGPAIVTKVLTEYMKKHKSKVLVLKSEFLEPCYLDVCNVTKNTIIQHNHERSWIPQWQYNVVEQPVKHLDVSLMILAFVFIIIIWYVYQYVNK
jgi:mannosyltransferase OCH1-like enzyme